MGESAYSEEYSGSGVELEEEKVMLAQEEHYANELKLQERELENLEWEKELKVREKEIAKKEQHLQKSSQFQRGQF